MTVWYLGHRRNLSTSWTTEKIPSATTMRPPRCREHALPRRAEAPHTFDPGQRAGRLGIRRHGRAHRGIREALLHLAQEAVEGVDAGGNFRNLGKFSNRAGRRLGGD